MRIEFSDEAHDTITMLLEALIGYTVAVQGRGGHDYEGKIVAIEADDGRLDLSVTDDKGDEIGQQVSVWPKAVRVL